MLTQEQLDKWLIELEDENTKQSKGWSDDFGGRCCLAVLGDQLGMDCKYPLKILAGNEITNKNRYNIRVYINETFESLGSDRLEYMNDAGASFSTIAQEIRNAPLKS